MPSGGNVSLEDLEKMGLQEASLARDVLSPLVDGLFLHDSSRVSIVKIALRIRVIEVAPIKLDERTVAHYVEATFDGSTLSWIDPPGVQSLASHP